MVLGREAFNDIVVEDPEVSRRHARISFSDDRYVIEDLGSTNGTFVNGRRIRVPTLLNNGDLIEMGVEAQITFQGPGLTADETVIETGSDEFEKATVAFPPGTFDAEYTAPTPQAEQPPPPTYSAPLAPTDLDHSAVQESLPPPQEQRDSRRIFLAFGCLIFVGVVACGAALFLLDALAPDALYCGPAQPLIELFGFNLICP